MSGRLRRLYICEGDAPPLAFSQSGVLYNRVPIRAKVMGATSRLLFRIRWRGMCCLQEV